MDLQGSLIAHARGAGLARPPVCVVALLVAVMLAMPSVSQAATRRATDREAGVRFTLDGRLLTVRLLPGAPASTRRELTGERVRAACGTSFAFTRGTKVRRTRLWPRGRRRLRYRFNRDLSRRAKWCLLEHPAGGDVAFVSF